MNVVISQIVVALTAITATTSDLYIVHVSDTPPGQTMIISGGGFDPSSVKVVLHVPGNLASQRDAVPEMVAEAARTYSGSLPDLPARPPEERTVVLDPLHASQQSVFVTLPGHPYPPGYTGIVWLKDGERWSNPLLVNAPQSWFLLKTTSRPGELNRLCGINLRGDCYADRYLFLRPVGGPAVRLAEVPRHREDGVSESFCAQFRLPADLKPGKYEVFLHNNSGGSYGMTIPLTLSVAGEPDFPQRLFMATEYGAAGDSLTDDRGALQQAIDAAGESGGGIVYLPPGSYRIDDTVQIREHVIVRGAGRNATTVFFGGAPGEKKRNLWLISARDVNHTGIEDLTVRVSHPMTYAVSYYAGGQPTFDTHLKRCRFVGGSVGIHYNVNMEVGECEFEKAVFFAHNLRQSWIHDNQFTVGRFGGNPVSFWGTENCTIEHNRAYKSNRGFVWQSHGVLGHYRNLIDANVVEDARFGGNAGETYLFEGSGFKWFGQPREVRGQGFTAADADWQVDSLKNAFAVVTAGRGLGQYRRIKSNTADTVTLADSWNILPGADARISIVRGAVENAIVNNRHVDCDNSMMFYGSGMLNNRILRNRSENSLGISVWSRAEMEKDVLAPDYYNIFDGNICEDQGSFWLTRLGDLRQELGIRNLNNIYRNNFLADVRRKRENQYNNVWEETRHGSYRPVQAAFWCDIGRSYDQNQTQSPIWIDSLIERNFITRCQRGIELRAVSGGTVVHRNVFHAVGEPILDEGRDTVILDNRIEP